MDSQNAKKKAVKAFLTLDLGNITDMEPKEKEAKGGKAEKEKKMKNPELKPKQSALNMSSELSKQI